MCPSLYRDAGGCLLRPLCLPLPWIPLLEGHQPRLGSWGYTQFCLCPCLPPPDLEQRILEVLRDSGSPVKTVQLVMKCQVPRKKLNQVLYKMQKETKAVLLVGPATWSLANGGTEEVVPAELGNLPPRDRGSWRGRVLDPARAVLATA